MKSKKSNSISSQLDGWHNGIEWALEWTYRGFRCAMMLRRKPVPTEWEHELETHELPSGREGVFRTTRPLTDDRKLAPASYTGYVQLPEEMDTSRFCRRDIYVYGGLSWGPDDDNWIGFDTDLGGDIHLDCDDNWTEGSQYYYHGPYHREDPVVWPPKSVADEVCEIVNQLIDG